MFIDSHVHIFPERVFQAIWRWFDRNHWSVKYQYTAEQVDAFLAERGVDAYIGLHYSHTEGMASQLNDFALKFSEDHPRCLPCATILPGEPGAEAILQGALEAGAVAIKIHSHVQKVAPNDPNMDLVYELATAYQAVLIIHCGNEPAHDAYGCNIQELCRFENFRQAIERYPDCKIVVPHLGMSDAEKYFDLLADFENLYLDTAMAIGEYFPVEPMLEHIAAHSDRVLFGTDFPNLPYAWDKELNILKDLDVTESQRAALLGGNAVKILKNFQ